MLLPTNSGPKQTQRLIGARAPSSHSYSTTSILPQPYDRPDYRTPSTATSTNRLPRTYGPQSRHSPSSSSQVRKTKPVLVVCIALGTLALAFAISIFTQNNEPAHPFGKPDPNQKFPVNISQVDYLYSTALATVGSKAIEDMLVANALAFNQKKTFGGACGIIAPDVKAQNEALIKALGLQSELYYACPVANDTKAVILTTAQYEYLSYRDTELMSSAWIKRLQKKIQYPKAKSKNLSIVAHVQRGDVTPCITEYVRYLPNIHFQQLIQQYFQRGKTDVTIISQTPSSESFQDFTASGYQLHLNRSIEEDWLEMLTADVLIMSRSSYSLVPAIFNRNTIVYTHYWHEPLPRWKVVPVDISRQSSQAIVKLRAKICHNTTKGFNLQQQLDGTDDDTIQSGHSGVEQGV